MINLDNYIEEFSSIMNLGNFIQNEYFYSELYLLLKSIQQSNEIEYTNLQDTFISFFNGWKQMLLSASYNEYGPLQTNNIDSLLELVQYPLMNTYSLKNKKYKDFNINVDFFTNIFKENSNIIAENDSEDDIIMLEEFEFTTTNKLKKFTLSNMYGIKWEYNKNYKLNYIIFADGSKIKIK